MACVFTGLLPDSSTYKITFDNLSTHIPIPNFTSLKWLAEFYKSGKEEFGILTHNSVVLEEKRLLLTPGNKSCEDTVHRIRV